MSSSFLKLNFPQWQGSYDFSFQNNVSEIKEREPLIQFYSLGSKIVSLLFGSSHFKEVPDVPMPKKESSEDLKIRNGIYAYNAIGNIKSTLKILEEKKPEKVLTVGGECSVSVPSFTYFADKHKGKIAIIWIDAHPDISIPEDGYPGFHAMTLGAWMGICDKIF